MTPGTELREARESMGLSLDDVSERTRIPRRYLEALEKDDLSVFPAGPFLTGFSKKYRTLVGLPDRAPMGDAASRAEGAEQPEPVHTVTSPARPSSRTRRRATQTALMGGLVMVVVLSIVRFLGDAAEPEIAAVGEPMALAVQVDVEEAVRVRVYADGERKFAQAVKPGRGVTFEGRDQVSVELETLEGVNLSFQGKPLKPLGHQSRPRRLVFIDDGG